MHCVSQERWREVKRRKCKLCSVKRKKWETDNFFGIECNRHFVPMIVLKEHRTELTDGEKLLVKSLIQLHYPRWYPDGSKSDSDEHWHIHLSRKKSNEDPLSI